MDHHLGCNYMSTKEDLEHVDPLHIDSSLFSNEIQKTEDTDCDMKAVNHQLASSEKKSNNSDIDKLIQLKMGPQIGDQVPPDGGYIWRNYLENGTRNSRHPSIEDQEPIVPEHQDYTEVYASASVDDGSCLTEDTISRHLQRNSSGGTETVHAQKGKKEIVTFKRKSKVELLDDGFKWRKYGKKTVKNSPNPRNYYRCSVEGCSVKKRVERDVEDAEYVITTYEGIHNHQCPSSF